MNTNECSSGFPARDLLMEFQEQVRGHGGTEGHFATDEHGLTRIIAKGNAELVWNHEWIRMQGPFGTTNGHECRGGF